MLFLNSILTTMLIHNPKPHVLTDWRIAQIEQATDAKFKDVNIGLDGKCYRYYKVSNNGRIAYTEYSPTTDWAVGGPVFERHRRTIVRKLLETTHENDFPAVLAETNLVHYMRVLVSAYKLPEHPIADLLFGEHWKKRLELF